MISKTQFYIQKHTYQIPPHLNLASPLASPTHNKTKTRLFTDSQLKQYGSLYKCMNVSENYTNKLCYNDLCIYKHQIFESLIDNSLENCLKPQVITVIFVNPRYVSKRGGELEIKANLEI